MLRTLAFFIIVAVTLPLSSAQDQPTTAPARSFADRLRDATARMEIARTTVDVAMKRQAYQQISDDLVRLANEDRYNVDVQLLIGDMRIDISDYNSAREAYKRALELDPRNFRALLGTAKVWVANGVYRSALKYLVDAQQVAPASERVEVFRLLAAAYSGTGEYEKAIDAAKEALALEPNDANTLSILARLHRDRNKFEDANEVARRLVEIAFENWKRSPESIDALQQLDAAYELQLSILGYNRPNGMLQLYYERNSRGAYTDQVRSGEKPQAARVLAQITEVVFRQANVRQLLMVHSALIVQRKAIEYDPRNVDYQLTLARLLLQMGDMAGAARAYEIVRTLDPQNKEVSDFFNVYPDAGQPKEQR